ncbi:hypothetical protein [Paraburkholderia phenazinium]|uniref:hypothetical protein n=1 Tax=Paraburkholderia phenazinium TaxID=60549 RepID=UPI00158978F8|nr:hypothetical protein [Paraburkholderia phenazinium]
MHDGDNIKMTVVINPLISPLLFDVLAGCGSARERAARLKALAESALRQQLTGRMEAIPAGESKGAGTAMAYSAGGIDEALQVLQVSDGTNDNRGFSGDSLGHEMASFFS